MNIIRFVIERKIFISMLFLSLSMLGYISYRFLPLELLPDVELPYLIVQVSSTTEVNPEYMEKQAIVPLEGVIGTMEGVSSIGTKIANKFRAGITWLKGIGGTIKDAAISALNFALSPIVEFWNANIKGIVPKMTVPKWVPGLSGKSFGPFPGELKYYAEGGLVNSPTLGMIGEAGPEAVIPLRGGSVPVQITGRQSEAEMVKAIKELSQQVAAHGNTFNINVDVSGVVATSEKAKEDLMKDISMAIMKDMATKVPSWVPGVGGRSWYS